jgi:hypothetical protein
MRAEDDEHWPGSRDWAACGGFARVRAAAALELDVPSGDEQPTAAELGERRGVQRDLLHARRLERLVGDAEHWSDRVSRILVAAIEASPPRSTVRRVPPAAPSYTGAREVVVLLSDLHYGMRIDPREVPGSSYGWREAARRTAYVVREAASYKASHRGESTCRLLLGGDIIEGELATLPEAHKPESYAARAQYVVFREGIDVREGEGTYGTVVNAEDVEPIS